MSAGLLDTSVVIDWVDPKVAVALPDDVAVRALTLAELVAGSHLASTGAERARRRTRLQQLASAFELRAFDAAVARRFGHILAAAVEA